MLAEVREVQKSNAPEGDEALATLERDGIVVLHNLLSVERVRDMQQAFEARLHRMRWNDLDGFEKEVYRHVIPDVLILAQGFVDLALHPLVKTILNRYLDNKYELTEAKGWKSLPTNRDFHGWHGDAWYDESATKSFPKEVKLAFYLTDVQSGAFNYIKGSHRKGHPRIIANAEVAGVPESEIVKVTGKAGTAFLFDTSGTHRQGVPILEPRQATFYNYHDPAVVLEPENSTSYRYHPLLLNAAFLGNLSAEDQRILGFGNQTRYTPAFVRPGKHELLQKLFGAALDLSLRVTDVQGRVKARLKRIGNAR
ncbi:MAG: phytanoyl-CoA dioxygenase family protein [Pyrinomonadaceae bacterium]